MYDLGFVKVGRELRKWKWYNTPHMVQMWVELMLTVAFSDYYERGLLIKRGQTLRTRESLAKTLGMSEQQVRTCLDRAKSTNDITTEKTAYGNIITLVNWDFCQGTPNSINQQINQSINQPITNEQPTNNQQITNKQPTSNQPYIKEDKEEKECKERKESLSVNNNAPEWFDTEVQKQDQADQEQKNIYECSLFDLFEREFARPLSQPECQRLGDWQERYDDKLIRYALRESLLYGKHSLDYIDRILLAWEKKAFTAEMYENGER